MQPLLELHDVAAVAGSASALLDPVARRALAPEALAALQLGMTVAVHDAFFVMAAATLAGVVIALWFPKTLAFTSEQLGTSSASESASPPRRTEAAAVAPGDRA
jgi:fucose permease